LKDQRGFTLIEMLFVLLILVIVSSITSQISLKTFERSAIDQFIVQVSIDIQRMQTLAMQKGIHTTIVFNSDNTYKGYVQNDYYYPEIEKKFPEGIRLDILGSNLKRITFNNQGDIADFGRIKFFTPYGEREIIVNIEKGRLRINGQ